MFLRIDKSRRKMQGKRLKVKARVKASPFEKGGLRGIFQKVSNV